jgi:hypothetical protein
MGPLERLGVKTKYNIKMYSKEVVQESVDRIRFTENMDHWMAVFF